MTTQQTRAEGLAQALSDVGALSVSLCDGGDHPIYESGPEHPSAWPTTEVLALFDTWDRLNEARRALRSALSGLAWSEATVEPLAECDWVGRWSESLAPHRYGSRLWVCPPGCAAPIEAGAVVVMEPGLAFGSGAHPTTALCLEWLDGATLGGARVIDYGCGSGILAIAAAKLGARWVGAIDIDPQALEATARNAGGNEVDLDIAAVSCREFEAADVLIANILLRPLLDLAPRFASLVRGAGLVVLSGVLQSQVDELLARYSNWFDTEQRVVRDEWALVVGRRRG